MNRNLKTEITGLYVTIIILVIALALMTGAARAQNSEAAIRGAKIGIAATSPDSYRAIEVREAYVRGAKIGIATDNPNDYRTEEVRGSCEDVFTADECIQCHEF